MKTPLFVLFYAVRAHTQARPCGGSELLQEPDVVFKNQPQIGDFEAPHGGALQAFPKKNVILTLKE